MRTITKEGVACLAVTCLLTAGCSVAAAKKQDVSFLDGHAYNEVWTASIRALSDIRFTVDDMDKDSGYIFATADKRNVVTQTNQAQLKILLTEEGGRVCLTCQAIQPGQIVDYGAGKKNIAKFKVALNARLKKDI